MSSVVLRADGEAVVVDPGVGADEVAALRDRASRGGARVTAVLATHADWDHVAGIAAFPEAVACMAPAAAERVRDGAARELDEAAERHGFTVEGPPRVDRVLSADDPERVGPFTVRAVPLPGHTSCSTAFEIPALGLLLAGDYLSPVEYPMCEQSPALYRRSLERLLGILGARPDLTVVPGHGPALTAAEAVAIGEEDLAYLTAVQRAIADGLTAGLNGANAVALGTAVEPPRPGPEEFAPARRRTAELEAAEILVGAP